MPLLAIDWQGNWAHISDFYGNDMIIDGNYISSVQKSSELSERICRDTKDCTHFSWAKAGNCWIKQGNVCKSQAKWSEWAICGFIKESCGSDVPKGRKFINVGNLLFQI